MKAKLIALTLVSASLLSAANVSVVNVNSQFATLLGGLGIQKGSGTYVEVLVVNATDADGYRVTVCYTDAGGQRRVVTQESPVNNGLALAVFLGIDAAVGSVQATVTPYRLTIGLSQTVQQ